MTADQSGAVVLIDGERRGTAGKPITDVCHGDHSVDVRSPTGQFSQRVRVEFDKEVRLQARLVPTYGVVRTAGVNTGSGAQGDLATVIQALRTDNLRFVPTALADADLASLASATGDDLRRATDGLIQRLDTQGIATVARVAADAEGRDVELRLFARGSSKPDLLRFSLQDSNLQRLVASLNPQIPVLKPTIGIDAVDVMRIDGAVVTSVEPGGPSAGLLVPGDVIVSVGVSLVANVAGLVAALEKASDAVVNVRLRDKPAPVTVVVERRPNVVSVYRESTIQCRDHRVECATRTAAIAQWRRFHGRAATDRRYAAESGRSPDGSRKLFSRATDLGPGPAREPTWYFEGHRRLPESSLLQTAGTTRRGTRAFRGREPGARRAAHRAWTRRLLPGERRTPGSRSRRSRIGHAASASAPLSLSGGYISCDLRSCDRRRPKGRSDEAFQVGVLPGRAWGGHHLLDQRSDVRRQNRSARAPAAFPGPEETELTAVHATTVSGSTRTTARRHLVQVRENHTQKRRSAAVRRRRGRRARSSTGSGVGEQESRGAAPRATERANEATGIRNTTMGITDRRLFDGDEHLNEFGRTDFLVGTGCR